MSEVAALNDNIDVTFFGHLGPSELYKMYERAHLFVLPSHSENFSIVIAEALSVGLPVLTSVNTPWEALPTHRAGYCIELSVQEIINSIRHFRDLEEAQRDHMSRQALRLAESYDWRTLGIRYREMYRSKSRCDMRNSAHH